MRHRIMRAALFALVLWVCGTAWAQPPLRLAVPPIPSSATVHLALAMSLFEQAGLPAVATVACANGNQCAQRLERGEADLAFVSDTAIVLAWSRGAQPQILATLAESRFSNRVVARRDAGIAQPGDLRGKRIGFLRGTSSHYFTEAFLAFHGLRPTDVRLRELDPQQPLQALVNGEVDAAGLFPPFAQRALAALGANGLTLPSPPVYSLSLQVVATPALDDARATQVLRALTQAEALWRRSPESSTRTVAQRLSLSPGEAAQVRQEFRFEAKLGQSLLEAFEAQARWAQSRGLVPPRVGEANFLHWLRPEPLRAVDAWRVSVSR